MPGTDSDYLGLIPASQITLADDTVANVTSTKHGFAPKSPGNAFKALDGGATPAWSSFDKLIATPVVASTTVSADVVSTTETLLYPVSTLPIPANQLAIGSSIRVRVMGRMTKGGIGSPTINLRIRFGGLTGTALYTSGALGNSTSATNLAFWLEFEITARTIGATGTVWLSGLMQSPHTNTNAMAPLAAITAAVTVDTTALADLAVTAEYSANTAGNSITIDQVKAWLD